MLVYPRGGPPDRSRVGERVGALTISGIAGRSSSGRLLYAVTCTCGRTEEIAAHRLCGPKRVLACSECRTPRCRACGTNLEGPTRRRTCSAQCRRALTAALARESYYRGGDDAREHRVGYNRARRQALPPERAAAEAQAKRAADRRRHHYLAEIDPAFVEARNAANRDYHARMSQDQAWRAKQRRKTRAQRAEKARLEMLAELGALGRDGEK